MTALGEHAELLPTQTKNGGDACYGRAERRPLTSGSHGAQCPTCISWISPSLRWSEPIVRSQGWLAE